MDRTPINTDGHGCTRIKAIYLTVLIIGVITCGVGRAEKMPECMNTELVDGVNIAYEEYGIGRPVVMVHGFGASSYSWRQVALSLSKSNRVVCVNLMGFGYSDKPKDETYNVERQADFLKRFLVQKQIESPVLVGHSYGGGVCLAMMKDSQKVSGLVLVDSMCYPQKFPFFIRALRSRFLRFIAFHLVPARMNVKSLLRQVYYRSDRIKPETINEYVSLVKSDGAQNAMVKTAKLIIPENVDDFTVSYSKISVPTLIIWGEHDKIVPISLGERLSKDIPTATFKVIPDCGHAPQEERLEETVAIIEEFLNQPRINTD